MMGVVEAKADFSGSWLRREEEVHEVVVYRRAWGGNPALVLLLGGGGVHQAVHMGASWTG